MTLTFSFKSVFFLINTIFLEGITRKLPGQYFSNLLICADVRKTLFDVLITSYTQVFLLYHMQFSIPPPPPPNKIWPLVLQLKYDIRYI